MAYDDIIIPGSTSYLTEVEVRDSATGQLKTGIAFGSFTFKYTRQGAASSTSVAPASMTQGTWVSGGIVETDNAGIYQVGVPNAALASGVNGVELRFSATGAIDKTKRILLAGSASSPLPGAVPTGPNGLLTGGTGNYQINAVAGIVDANTRQINGSAVTPSTYPVLKNSATANFMFPMFDATTGAERTGLSVAGQVSIDGAAFTNLTNAVAEIGSGVYQVNLAAADTNGNRLMLKFTATGARTMFVPILTHT